MVTSPRILIAFAALLAAAMILATGALAVLAPGGWRPDLFVLAFIPVALLAPDRWALAAGFATGMAKDAASGGRFGPMALCFTVAAFALARLRRVLGADSPITHVVFGILGVWLTEGALLLAGTLNEEAWPGSAAFGRLLGSSLITGLLAPLWMLVVDRVGRSARRKHR